MPRQQHIARTLMAVFIGAAILGPQDVWAARKHAVATQAHATKTHAVKTHKAKRSKNLGSESAAERDRRLLRECKGLPNAGACLGYAS